MIVISFLLLQVYTVFIMPAETRIIDDWAGRPFPSMSRYAAIDIGSNSIRMLAAEVPGDGPMRDLAADRQVVRLGTGVFRDGRLNKDAIELGCQVLARM